MNPPHNLNIVLLAENHNPSIISKEWIIQNKLLEGEIINFAHLPVASIVEDIDYNLFIDENSLRLDVKNVNETTLINSPEILKKYIEKLPEIPYTAIGFNFIFNLKEDQTKLENIFISDVSKLKEIFSEHYTFGTIVKFSFEDFIATVKITPDDDETIKADFNFHYPSNNTAKIIKALEKYDKTLERAQNVITDIFES